MNWGFVKPVIDSATNAWGAVFGNRQERDRQAHEQYETAYGELSAEFTAYRANRTWWDSLVDGINRLPRPVMVALVINYFVLSWIDPALFAEINAGLATVPEPMWWLLGSIVGFYFAAREMHHHRSNRNAFAEAADAAREMRSLRAPEPTPFPTTTDAPKDPAPKTPSATEASGVFDPLARFES